MRKGLVLSLSLLFASISFILPLPSEVKKGLFILVFTAALWITESLPLPVTSLLVPVLSVLLGVLNVKSAFSSFAHPIIFLFFGGFALATALKKHAIDKLIAYKIVSVSKGSLFTTSVLLFLSTAFVSMWISNTSTTAMMLPLALGILGAVRGDSKLKTFMLLGIAYSSSIGGIGTLVGSPPNGITAANLNLSFTDWLIFGIPTVLILLPLLFLILYLYFRPNLKEKITFEKASFRLTKEGKLTFFVFLITALMWLFSKPISHVLGIRHYFDAVAAVFAVVLLFLFNIVSWKEINEGTDWGTLYLFGGGIALSHVLKVTGTSKFIASLLTRNIGGLPSLLVVLLVTLFMIFMTELMSNTATAAIFIPILITAAVEMNLPPYELALPAGIAASCAFMLPVATPPNAIVYGTGFIKQRDMLKVGFILNLIFALAIALITVLITNKLVG